MTKLVGTHMFSDKASRLYRRYGGNSTDGAFTIPLLREELLRVLPKGAKWYNITLKDVLEFTRSGRVCARFEALI